MNEKQLKTENKGVIVDIKEQVRAQMATLSTRVPTYEELTPEEREKVDAYIASIDLSDPSTIDGFGERETEEIYKGLDMLIGTMKTHDVSIDEMFTDLMVSIGEEEEEQSFTEQFKKSPIKAIRNLKNRPKRMLEKERYRRAKVLSNIDVVKEKLEGIRCELRVNAGKLEVMAENSAEQYRNTQYQIVALQEVARKIEEQRAQIPQTTQKTFDQIDGDLKLVALGRKVSRKLGNCQGINVNAATKAIMSRLLAIHNEELASNYDQDISSLVPELKGIIVTAEANDSLIQAANTRNQFVGAMNEMLRSESERSKKAMEEVQRISGSTAIDVETAQTLTGNVLEVIRSLKRTQEEARPTNEAFTTILTDFRTQLARELEDKSKTPQKLGEER